jgi:hypothetical protein
MARLTEFHRQHCGSYVQRVCTDDVVFQGTVALVEGGYKRGERGGDALKSLLSD